MLLPGCPCTVVMHCSLHQLCELYRGLSVSDAAADWLRDTGLMWCTTCHLDLPQVGVLLGQHVLFYDTHHQADLQ